MATDTSTHYLGEQGAKYYREKFGDRMLFGRLIQLEYFRPYCHEDRDLLDFGCSDGLSLRTLPARTRIGIEVNPSAIDRGRQLAKEQGVAVEFLSSLGEVADESIDLAISNHCLEHVPSPLDALREIHRVLRPGGRLVLVVPFDDWRDKKNRSWRPDDPDHHLFTFCPLNLGNLVGEAGLHCENVEVCRTAWSPRIFWVDRVFGRTAFRLACQILSRWLRRVEILCIATK
ncbi:MAG: class I SAM-dependent methyltransferase [Planctomycetales bacterium]|nr:class I SAM-dependent methyltransferase [Planctomycetales bacterium]